MTRTLRELLRSLGDEDSVMMSERAHETRNDTDDNDQADDAYGVHEENGENDADKGG